MNLSWASAPKPKVDSNPRRDHCNGFSPKDRCRYSFRRLDPAEIYQTLGENAVLLCWEKPWDACHRRIVAEWLESALSIEIPEYGFARRDCPSYEGMVWATKRRIEAEPTASQPAVETEDRLHDYGRRWASGEGIAVLAKEAGMSWNRLWSELPKLGYRKGT